MIAMEEKHAWSLLPDSNMCFGLLKSRVHVCIILDLLFLYHVLFF